VQALTYRLRPFPRKVNLHRVGVQNAVHTGPVGELNAQKYGILCVDGITAIEWRALNGKWC
jgi:hypothetical protein